MRARTCKSLMGKYPNVIVFTAIVILGAWFCPLLLAQEAAPAAVEAPAPVAAVAEGPANSASLFYRNVDPKLLFQILSELYHVQFEGTDSVTGPLTLISKEKEMVDVDGMLLLLNEVLSEQNKAARREGPIIRIVQILDTERRWISLQNADPVKVVEFLKDLYLPRPDDKPEETARKVSLIKVHPELPRILVVGPKEILEEIEKLVHEELDKAPEGAEGEVIPTELQPDQPPLLRQFFALDYMDAAEFQQLLQKDETLKGRFTSAVAQNTVIVFSREKELFNVIEEVRKAFDVDRMEIRYLPLKIANAEDVAGLLQAIYPAEAVPEQVLPAELQQIRRQRTLESDEEEEGIPLDQARVVMERAGIVEPGLEQLLSQAITVVAGGELNIVPDKARNALLIRTFSRNFPKIIELIEEFDIPLKQVLIDVFITEVTLDNTTELGIDFTYLHNERTNTLRQVFPDTTSTIAGISYNIISDNIVAYIRALQETGKLDTVSRPQILTKDNSPAELKLGRDVPIVTATNVSTAGAVNSSVSYTPVQTQLLVTPQIHPDNYVTLNLDQKIDDVSTETFQISQNFNPQVLIRRSAKTVLRVKDGQTVCLGGFVGDSIREKKTRVPLLADIPLLGYLFEYSSKERVKTELILFITPHILENPTEILRMTNTMRRLSKSTHSDDRDSDILEPQRDLRYPPYRIPLEEVELPEAVPLEKVETPQPEASAPAPQPEAPAAEPVPAPQPEAQAAPPAPAPAEAPAPPPAEAPPAPAEAAPAAPAQ